MSKRPKKTPKPDLFVDESGQLELVDKSMEQQVMEKQQVECLGMTFENDEKRREYFLEILRKKLRDPEFRKIEGFPIGEDEDILALSNPPYYTACPNPFIEEFINLNSKDRGTKTDDYRKEPFSADVSEGKNDPVYNAHSYHTKVPHKAVMRYILHYTKPGDIILDGFCGTGMTGVAAGLCSNSHILRGLGYRVNRNNDVMDKTNAVVSQAGKRFSLLTDLSPFATFIASNYTNLSDLGAFAKEAKTAIQSVEKSLSWLYEFNNARVYSAIWSDVFRCPNCSRDLVFWDTAINDGRIGKSFPCPHCGTVVGKSSSKSTGAVKLERAFETQFDPCLDRTIRVPKLTLVEQNIRKDKKRISVKASQADREAFLSALRQESWPEVPTDQFFSGRQTNKLINGSGISYVCHMYTPRALFVYGTLWNVQLSSPRYTSLFRFCLSSINNYIS